MAGNKIKRLRPKLGYQKGFTLIEVLVASAILVILAFGFLGLQYIIGQNQVSVWRNYLSIEYANSTLSNLSKELRSARQGGNGRYLLEVANDNEIVFYSDIDHDGNIERVRYTLSQNQLIKGVVKPEGEPVSYPLASEKARVVTDIIRNANTPVFYYYNSSWPGDTENNPLPPESRISDTTQVKIMIRTNPKANDAENDYILESNVRLRMVF
jgi:prepilin-type N-terminal cleavage/methylation domain-containing protein